MADAAPAGSPRLVWSFGFGSNMNVDFVQDKKGLKVHSYHCAALPGWRIGFNLHGMDRVEPSFANAVRSSDPDDEIHGVAIQLSEADSAELDRQEGAYAKAEVTVTTYAGQQLEAYMYTKEQPPEKGDRPCSRRYLNVLVSGAEAAGLSPAYVAKLAARPTYAPSEETLRLRATLPAPGSLPAMTVEELAAHDKEQTAEFGFVGVYGYIFRVPRGQCVFRSHLSRDMTARASRQWRGISLDANDDMGRPPFRLAGHMDSADEVEYVWQWLDHYLGKAQLEGVVAFLAEYREQTEREAAVAP